PAFAPPRRPDKAFTPHPASKPAHKPGEQPMKDNPLISIYMPTWNRQQLAIRAIKSVLRQDYNNWEMIIVDDCSTSWEQLQQYVTALNDPRITYIHNDINR
ncbi:glycosyltransferase, partial [Pseudomonas aeruginosa]|uniref:glycosyltransferase n=1 Tax=Pseudomonas aeruginosa TaxID=287 RepID=UPI0031B6D8B9